MLSWPGLVRFVSIVRVWNPLKYLLNVKIGVWCDDNMPKWIKLGLPHWKGKKNLALWKFYLHRNMVDVRFCPVSHLMLWLNASEIKRGPLFPKIRNGHILVAFRIKSVTIDQRTMNQWVCEKNDSQVHMSYDEFASTTKHLFNLIAELYLSV